MLNKRIRKSIIGISKTILLVVMLLLLGPQLIRFSSELSVANRFFQAHQMSFMLIHGIFYLALYGCWPKLITVLINHSNHEISESQIRLALHARRYLLAALVFSELLVWWR